MLYADLKCSIDGGTMVFFTSLPQRCVVEVHLDTRGGGEEEFCASFVGIFERGGVVEVSVADGYVLSVEVGETGG